MRLSFTTIVLSTALLLGERSKGYYIDPDSCGDDTAFVRSMVEQAFTMAEIASAAVKVEPMEDFTNNITGWMLNANGNVAKTLVQSAFDASMSTGDPVGVLSFQEEKTGDVKSIGDRDVAIFCNTDRMESRSRDQPSLYDNKLDVVLESDSKDCLTPTFMYTMTIERRPDVIQICPWFLQYAKAKKYGTTRDISHLRTWMAVKGLDTLITKVLYTPIDLLELWDKTMLHEMMHTTAAGVKRDVGDTKGYGWKNCRDLAVKQPQFATNNADTWALIGSALYWGSQGSPVDENGKFTEPPAPRAGRKAKRWLGSGSGRALDAVKGAEFKIPRNM